MIENFNEEHQRQEQSSSIETEKLNHPLKSLEDQQKEKSNKRKTSTTDSIPFKTQK